jgi:putative membrane protein
VTSGFYIGGMRQEDLIRQAEFNPRIKQYIFSSVALVFTLCIVTIPLLLLWVLGWGKGVARIHFNALKCSLTSRHLRFSKGHYFKKEKTIPLENIQDLTFIDNPVLKWFDLRILKVETAGNSDQTGADMKLVGIVDAEGFKEEVMLARDRFQEGRLQPVIAPLEAGDGVVEVLKEIHASIEALRGDLTKG